MSTEIKTERQCGSHDGHSTHELRDSPIAPSSALPTPMQCRRRSKARGQRTAQLRRTQASRIAKNLPRMSISQILRRLDLTNSTASVRGLDPRGVLPRVSKGLEHTPLLDEAIKNLQHNLEGGLKAYSDYDMGPLSCRPDSESLLRSMPSSEPKVQRVRYNRNCNNKAVDVLRLYPSMARIAYDIDMRGLKGVAYSCTTLRNEIDLERAESYKNWAERVTSLKFWSS